MTMPHPQHLSRIPLPLAGRLGENQFALISDKGMRIVEGGFLA